jgi:hypothetical protein
LLPAQTARDVARRRAASLPSREGPSRGVARRRVFKKCMQNYCFAARRRATSRGAAQLSGKKAAQIEPVSISAALMPLS